MRVCTVILTLVLALPALAQGASTPSWELEWDLPDITEARGITTDAQNNVFAVDGLGHRVHKYDMNGNYLGTFGSEGSGNKQFLSPTGIASDGTNVYVADQGNYRIQKFTVSAAYVTSWGSSGTGEGEFTFLIDVEVAPGGDVYTLDGPTLSNPTGIPRVQRFTNQGAFIQAWGGVGSAPGQFRYPGGLATDADGNVYVADTGNGRIQKFSPSGTFLDQFSATQPTGIDVDSAGNLYAVDRVHAQVQQFKSDGTLVGTWGSQGPNPGEFETPWDVATGTTGNVFVSDNKPRIQRFGYGVPVQLTTWGSLKTLYSR